MHSDLLLHLANAPTLLDTSAPAPAVSAPEPEPPVIVLRRAGPADRVVLRRLAALDSALPLEGDVLLAFADDEPLAALVLADGRVAADPFRHTHEAVTLLRMRAERLLAERPAAPARRRGLRRLAAWS